MNIDCAIRKLTVSRYHKYSSVKVWFNRINFEEAYYKTKKSLRLNIEEPTIKLCELILAMDKKISCEKIYYRRYGDEGFEYQVYYEGEHVLSTILFNHDEHILIKFCVDVYKKEEKRLTEQSLKETQARARKELCRKLGV